MTSRGNGASSAPIRSERKFAPSGRDWFGAVFEAAPTGMALLRSDGICLEVNPELSRVLGFSARHLRRHRLHELAEPEHGEAVLAALARLGTGDSRTESVEARFRRSDGRRPIWLEVSLALARGDGGGPAPVVAQFHCIGPRKKEERRLADDDARFRRAFEGSAIGIGLLALPGSAVVQANDALCSMLQRHREDLLGSDLLSLVDPADFAGMKALLSGLRNRRDPAASRELRFVVGPQQVLWALVLAAPVDGDRGIRRHALVQVVDIAAQKETELALRHRAFTTR